MLINEVLGVTGWQPQPVIRRQGWLYSDQNHPNPRNSAKLSLFFNQHAVITKQVSASPTDWQQHPRYQDVMVGVQNATTAAMHSRFASLCSSVLEVKSRLVLDLSTRSLPGTSVSSGPLANRTYLGGRYSLSATNGLLRMGPTGPLGSTSPPRCGLLDTPPRMPSRSKKSLRNMRSQSLLSAESHPFCASQPNPQIIPVTVRINASYFVAIQGMTLISGAHHKHHRASHTGYHISPSFLVTRVIGKAQGLELGTITPSDNICSSSRSTTIPLVKGIRYALCLIGGCSPVSICIFTTLIFFP